MGENGTAESEPSKAAEPSARSQRSGRMAQVRLESEAAEAAAETAAEAAKAAAKAAAAAAAEAEAAVEAEAAAADSSA